jgi:hypothetical protein
MSAKALCLCRTQAERFDVRLSTTIFVKTFEEILVEVAFESLNGDFTASSFS